uniref:Adenosine 5'-monophosphoramidase HINT3 n=1 Tax=Clastoptera arizonana TaxID=38151 RepID=A0A1B6DG90_9HEMI
MAKCIFCDIVHSNDSSKIIFEDDDVVVFPDIKPAAPHHYLVVPKEHIKDAKSLKSEFKTLVQKMVDTGNRILQEKEANLHDSRLGFHWPPFNSISHLHLHVIAPQSEMNLISRAIFKQDSWWFVSPEYVISRL